MSILTKSEEIVLLAILKLKDSAYGVPIKKTVSNITGKDWNYGTLYCTLEQLSKKKLVNKYVGDPTSVLGGRSKIFYTLTSDGLASLKYAKETQKRMWDGVNELELISK